MAAETSPAAAAELGISGEIATALKDVLINYLPTSVAPNGNTSEPELYRKANTSIETALDFIRASTEQARWTVILTRAMSLTVFAVGIGMMLVATVRALIGSGGEGTTAVIGGIGLIQIVALFYRNPLRDIMQGALAAQRTNVTVMSYALGIALIGESVYAERATADDLARLIDLTERTNAGLGLHPATSADSGSRAPATAKPPASKAP